MKYEKPVRDLLLDCARSLPEPFTRAQIIEWFARHYPDVRETTVGAHIAGLTAQRNPATAHDHLSNFPPVLDRVARGQYRRHRALEHARAQGGAATALEGDSQQPRTVEAEPSGVASPTDFVLVGCVKSKAKTAQPGQSLYTSPLFTRRRRYAELSGVPWFIISSRWGLVEPTELVAPYDEYLGDQPAAYRRAWGAFVAAQLSRRVALEGAMVEVHAGDPYVSALRAALEALGARVLDAVDARSMGETLAWYDRVLEERRQAVVTIGGSDRDEAATFLGDQHQARPLSDLVAVRRELAGPGLYSWWVDEPGAADLTVGLGHLVRPGLVYAGSAGATSSQSGKTSGNTLWGRIVGMHLGPRADFSTFRLSLMAVLSEAFGDVISQEELTRWMYLHLRVAALVIDDASALGRYEMRVLQVLDPPLNLRHMPATPLRRELGRLRAGVRSR